MVFCRATWSAFGTKRTFSGRGGVSASQGRTDMPRPGAEDRF
jgi:hypothetical protein